jgi:putative transposase
MRRNKKSAIRFLTRLLRCYPSPRLIVTDKLRRYVKPIRQMCSDTEHRSHKGLNNHIENANEG